MNIASQFAIILFLSLIVGIVVVDASWKRKILKKLPSFKGNSSLSFPITRYYNSKSENTLPSVLAPPLSTSSDGKEENNILSWLEDGDNDFPKDNFPKLWEGSATNIPTPGIWIGGEKGLKNPNKPNPDKPKVLKEPPESRW